MSDAALQEIKPGVAGPRYQPLVIVAVAVCAGIVADRYLPMPASLWWTTGVLALCGWLVLRRRARDRPAAALLLVAVAASSGAWHHRRWCLFARNEIGLFARSAEGPVCVQAVARTGPRRQPAPAHNPMRIIPAGPHSRLDVDVVAIRNRAEWQPAAGRVHLDVDGELLGVRAGDRLEIFGHLRALEAPHNPGEFDFAERARVDRRLCVLRAENPACVTVVAEGGPMSVARWIDDARTAGSRLIYGEIGERYRGLAAAVLLGIREEVTTEQTEALMETGTVHIICISGLHVGILAATLFFFMRTLAVRRKLAAACVAATTVFYVLLTDAEPPAVRAMVIVLVMCTGYAFGRRSLSFNVLGAAAIVILAMNPPDLFRAGVQLSFLCVGVLCWFGGRAKFPEDDPKRLERLVAQSRPWPMRMAVQSAAWTWDLFWVGLLLWLATIPLVMNRFHMLSLVALVMNTVLWLPMTLIVWSGLGFLAIGTLTPMLAAPLGWCCDRSLALLQGVIDFVRHLPAAYFWVPGPAVWWLVGFYGGLAVLAAYPRRRPPRRWCVALAAGWLAAGFLPSILHYDPPRLKTTFLAVDHGLAVVLRLPCGATMLYDAGLFTSPEMGAEMIAGYLWSQGITHVDAIVLSHPDADHFNAVPGLLERFSVGAVYVSPLMFREKAAAVDALRDSLRGARVPVCEVSAGDRLRGDDGCRLEVLHPPRRGVFGSDNANSLVLAVEYEGNRLILTGDLEPPGLEDVVAEEPWPCDVLLVPHHGSLRSDAPALAAWASPRWAVVSAGHKVDVLRAAAAYRNVGARILHTAKVGAIDFEFGAAGVKAATFRGGAITQLDTVTGVPFSRAARGSSVSPTRNDDGE